MIGNVVANMNGKHLFLDINNLGSDIFAAKVTMPVSLENRISFADSCRVTVTIGGVIIDNFANGMVIKDAYESYFGRKISWNDPVKSAPVSIYVYRIRTDSMPIGVGNIRFMDGFNGRKYMLRAVGSYACTVENCESLMNMITVNGGVLSTKQLNNELKRSVLFGIVESVLAEYLETGSYEDLTRNNYKVIEKIREEFTKRATGFAINSFAFQNIDAEALV